ncbi:MAG: hypothetical protein IJC39_04575 [Firmicutes bacterium]|nr:hypothetical protein [Bacillota bacterium]
MKISDELKENIRAANDIVSVISEYVPLKPKGDNYWGLCPFHNERTPSFSVNARGQFYHCFGCGAGGDVFGFLMAKENMDFPSAMERLAERGGIKLPEEERSKEFVQAERLKARLYEMHKVAGRFFLQLP